MGLFRENSSRLYVGLIGRENELEITNDGMVRAVNAYIGHSSSAHSNRVAVSDGALMNLSGTLSVGSYSSGNELNITDGYVLARNAVIGRGFDSIENKVTLDGGRFSTISEMILGGSGSNNVITVYEGYVGTAGSFVIGQNETAGRNLLDAYGTNSVVVARSMTAGADGQYNRFNARQGALVDTYDFSVGTGETARGNVAWIYGRNTELNTYNLTVGGEGKSSHLRIYEGAEASVFRDAFMGYGSNSTWNLMLVDGEDARLTINGSLHVGVDGRHNRLLVKQGGALESGQAFIGSGPNAKFNRVEISSGSLWTNRNHMGIANGSTLLIGSGARVDTGSYSQDGSSTLAYGFDAEAGSEGVGLMSVADSAVFEEGALIDFQAPLSQLNIGDEYTLMTANQIVGGTLTNDVSHIIPNQLLLDVRVVETNGRAGLQYTRKSLVDATDLEGTELAALLNTIDEIAPSNAQAEVMLQAVNRTDGSGAEVAEQLEQLYNRRVEVVSVVDQARITAVGQISAHVRTVQEKKYTRPVPVGPSGPHKAGQGWSPWFKAYGTKGRASEQEAFSAYDARTYGGVFGIDRSLGAILGGVAAG